MNLILLIGVALCLRVPTNNRAFQNQRALLPFILPRSNGSSDSYSPKPSPFPKLEVIKLISPEGKFDFDVICTSTDRDCKKVHQTIQAAGGILENLIEFTTTSFFKLNILKGCYGCKNPSGGAVTHFNQGKSKVDTMTTANAKQLERKVIPSTDKIFEEKYDAVIFIYYDKEFYFIHDYDEEIGNRLELFDTLIHEILHGLGFATFFSRTPKGYLVPELLEQKEKHFKFVLSPYEEHLHLKTTSTPIKHLFDEINDSKLLDGIEHHLALSTLDTSRFKLKLRSLKNALTHKDQVYFKTNKSEVYIETKFLKYTFGQSVLHLAEKECKGTTEAVMYYSNLDNSKIVLANNPKWKTAPLGPKTMEIMDKIGYHENPNSNHRFSFKHLIEALNKDFKK